MNPRNEERDRICNLPAPPNRDWVSHEYTGYHYDAETEECDLVYYDLITKNDNLFPSLDECLDFCLPTESDSKQNNSKLTTTERTTTSSTKLPSSTPTSTAPKTTTSITTKPTTTKPQKLSTKEVLKLPECSLQPQPGHCKALIHSYYFNITTMRCQQYIYGGCGATANHYLTEAKCEQSCVYRKSKPRHPIIVTPSEPLRPKKDKYCEIPIYDNNCMHRSHQGFLFQPSTNSCHFTVVNRCSRPLALHKRREACVASCVRATPGIFKIPLFRSKSN
uniref:BPTI/Kunitz inhibitor domain-containing protein n=1 Tax=Panagrolaimus superbus TaxID=310955 RepID=A0A914Z9K5_9BILA